MGKIRYVHVRRACQGFEGKVSRRHFLGQHTARLACSRASAALQGDVRAAPEHHVLRVCCAGRVPGVPRALPRVVHVDQPAQLRQQQRLHDTHISWSHKSVSLMTEDWVHVLRFLHLRHVQALSQAMHIDQAMQRLHGLDL